MSFPGPIEEIPDIYVDNFECRTKKAYFLSHAHSDHYPGLYSNKYLQEIVNEAGKIYMSEETKTVAKYFVMECRTCIMDLMEPLKTGKTYTIELAGRPSFEVTLIPVTHMVGAVMFLFKTDNKTILYTGDLIIEKNELQYLKELHHDGIPLAIDAMYIDTTFDTDHVHFPERSSLLKEATDTIEQWLMKCETNGVALYQDYAMGYEDLHISIYKRTRIKLYWYDTAIHYLYRELYGDDSPLTEEPSRIHICRNKKHSESHWHCCDNQDLNYLYIFISATRGCFYEPGEPAISRISSDTDLYLCFPTHCGKSQREAFEEYFPSPKIVRFPDTPIKQPPRDWTNIVCPYRDKRDTERELRELFSLLPFEENGD